MIDLLLKTLDASGIQREPEPPLVRFIQGFCVRDLCCSRRVISMTEIDLPNSF